MPSHTVVDWKFPSELYGAAKALSVGFIVKPVGEPDAGHPHVRFDERGGKRDDVRVATAPNPDSTENTGSYQIAGGRQGKNAINCRLSTANS
jgi:hypothetical protein